MSPVTISRLTPKGVVAFKDLIAATTAVACPSERIAGAKAILADRTLCLPVPDAGAIDMTRRFSSVYEFCAHVHPALAPLGKSGLRDRGINLFLYLAYVDQMIATKARVVENYMLDERRAAGGLQIARNYRNPIFVHLSLYAMHRDADDLCRQMLASQPHELRDLNDKISQLPEISESRAALELVYAMFYDKATARNRKVKNASARKGNSLKIAFRELCSVVFRQCASNYDLSRMTAGELLELVPNSRLMKPWKAGAAEALPNSPIG